uniref:RING-type domain-containing protein n=1 Tax=Caenorhabditis tropicalis TaxID=1561998 RepID=A0A1I7U306_9PELO
MSDWDDDDVWEEDKKIVSYNARQKDIQDPVMVPLVPPQEWPSCLHNIDPVRVKEVPVDIPYCFRTLSGPSGVLRTPNKRFIPNKRWLDTIRERQIEKIRSKTKSCFSMAESLFIPLGPQQIRRIKEIIFYLSLGTYHTKLVQKECAFLIVLIQDSEERTIEMIEKALRNLKIVNDVVFESEDNSGALMELKYGEEPKIISDSSDSTLLVVVDDAPAKEFYEGRVDCQIVQNRILQYPEKILIEQMVDNYFLKTHPLRLLEFTSPQDRQNAKELLSSVEVLYCGAMHDYSKVNESASLFISYEMTPKNKFGVAITIKNEYDKENIENTFARHHLYCVYCKDQKRSSHSKYDEDVRTMYIENFSHLYKRNRDRLMIVQQIIAANEFEVENVELYERPVKTAMTSCGVAQQVDIVELIEEKLVKVGKSNNIYWPTERHLRTIRMSDDIPWMVSRTTERFNENCIVTFKDSISGQAFIDTILHEAHFNPVFAVDKSDRYGPLITPCLRKTFSISRTLRCAFDMKIKEFDEKIRRTAVTDWDPLMQTNRTQYYTARLFDEWQDGSETGIIGVMGWSSKFLDHLLQKLRDLLDPLIFEGVSELLYGIGEVYVKSLMTKYNGGLVVEVDKFNQHIKLVGDSAEKAFKDLQNYQKQRCNIQMFSEIIVDFPYFNPGIKDLVDSSAWREIRMALGIDYLRFDIKKGIIEFEGNVEAFTKLMEVLEEFSSEIFKMETMEREEAAPTCPTCWTEIDSATDYFRFQCGHVMCRLCVNAKVRSMESTKLICEHEGCGKFVTPSEIENIILGGADRIKDYDFQKMINLNQTIKNEILSINLSIKQCSTANCNGLRIKSQGGQPVNKQCGGCSASYCRLCLENSHGEVSCEEHRALQQPDYSIQAYIRSVGAENVKKCPKCSLLVEKIDGCNHVQCGRCKIHFCWLCLFYIDGEGSGSIYAHMTEVHGGIGLENNVEQFIEQDWELRPPTPPPPTLPPRAIHYDVLPLNLQALVTPRDEHIYLDFINSAETLDQQIELIEWAMENLRH